MHLEIPYYYFNGAFSDNECDDLIQMGLEANPHIATTYGESTDKTNKISRANKKLKDLVDEDVSLEDTYSRDSHVSWLHDPALIEHINNYIKEANKKAGWNWDIDSTEPVQFTIYKPGQFFSWHEDGGSDWNAVYRRVILGVNSNDKHLPGKKNILSRPNNMIGKIRKISVIVSLTNPNDYVGGDLKFDFGANSVLGTDCTCTEIKPRGNVVVFPSWVPHCVTPVESGTRYSLVMWALGKPYK